MLKQKEQLEKQVKKDLVNKFQVQEIPKFKKKQEIFPGIKKKQEIIPPS